MPIVTSRLTIAAAAAAAALALVAAVPAARGERIKELADVEGVRGNPLVGYGLVVGLAGTGDDASSAAVRRPLAALMKKLGVTVSEAELKAKNVAAVVITAELPPFARPGAELDIVVSSTGSAKSLAGGTLVATPLRGADLEVYAVAQGSLVVGGFAAGGASGSSVAKNHVTVGRVPGGATVEQPAPGALPQDEIVLILREADFTTATRIADAIDAALGGAHARVDDPGAVHVAVPADDRARVATLIARIEALEVEPDAPARIVIDERTGTIAVGAAVRLGPAAIAHGGLTVDVAESRAVSQPGPLADGETRDVAVSELGAAEAEGELVYVAGAPTVAELAAALDALGARPRDLVAIFLALREVGALRAELVTQ